MNQLQNIADIVKELVGNAYMYFDEALTVKKTPHTWPVNLWAVCVSPKGEVFVMDGAEEWYRVEEKDTLIIPSLYQRVTMISKQFKQTA
jgi:hypothetical protein